jgi:hypothetical protein
MPSTLRSPAPCSHASNRLVDPEVAALVATVCRLAEQQRPQVRAVLGAYLPTEDVRLLSRAELLEAAAAGQVVVVDVRPAEEFAAGASRAPGPYASAS